MESDLIKDFLNQKNNFAIVGVSRNPKKYGRIVYENLKNKGFTIFGINPKIDKIDNDKIYDDLIQLSKFKKIDVIIFVVPPNIVKEMIADCLKLGIKKIWLQPGSESNEIIKTFAQNKIDVIYNQCIMLTK
jgi:predicted CoA-binding protein